MLKLSDVEIGIEQWDLRKVSACLYVMRSGGSTNVFRSGAVGVNAYRYKSKPSSQSAVARLKQCDGNSEIRQFKGWRYVYLLPLVPIDCRILGRAEIIFQGHLYANDFDFLDRSMFESKNVSKVIEYADAAARHVQEKLQLQIQKPILKVKKRS